MPLVSVIVPNYNHAPYLRQRLDSIYNQTFQDFEVIILDDCSTDNSKEIIEEYRNRQQTSHIVYNEFNSGSPFKQWAKGFDLAQGEYIWIAESDDWAEINFLEIMVDALNQDFNSVFAFCDMFMVFPEKTIEYHFSKKSKNFNGIKFIKTKQLYENNIINASAVVFRKKILSFIPSDYQAFKGSGDYMFWSYISEHGTIFYEHNLLNYFRRHPLNTTKKNNFQGLTFQEGHKIFEYFQSKNYITFFTRYRIVQNKLEQIENCKPFFINLETYYFSKKLWLSTINNGWFGKMLLAIASIANIFNSNLPPIAKFWKIFHLPNTNFRHNLSK